MMRSAILNKRVGVADAALHLSEFMLLEHGAEPVPPHLADEVDALVQMLKEFELEPLRDLWWSGARESHPSEGDVFVVRCSAFHRAINDKMTSRFGRGLAELSEEVFDGQSKEGASAEAPPGWRTVEG